MDGLSDAKINAAHSVDVRLRINGQDEWWCGESYIKGLIHEVAALRKRVEELEQTSFDLCPNCGWRTAGPDGCFKERAERAEAKLADAYTQLSLLKSGDAYAKLQADLDAALLCLGYAADAEWLSSEDFEYADIRESWQRVAPLLEKRREQRG